MSITPFDNLSEIFAAPIEGLIAALGKGVADAQTALDTASAQAQDAIDSDPLLSQHGVQATWYQFPRVELKLKLALSVASPPAPSPSPVSALPLRLIAQPVTAGYQNRFNFDAQAASMVSVSLVPVPGPHGADQSAVTPQMTRQTVESIALGTGKFATKGSGATIAPDPSLRFEMNFNATNRLWYVLQYSATDATKTPVIAVIDDVTGQIRA